MKIYDVDDPPCPGSFCALQPPVLPESYGLAREGSAKKEISYTYPRNQWKSTEITRNQQRNQ